MIISVIFKQLVAVVLTKPIIGIVLQTQTENVFWQLMDNALAHMLRLKEVQVNLIT